MNNYKIIAIGALILTIIFMTYRLLFIKDKITLTPLTTNVTLGNLSTQVTATGIIRATEVVEVGTQVSGIVSKLYVDYNSVVKKGQLLAELDKENLIERLVQSQSQHKVATTELTYQKTIFDRNKSLYDNDLISLAEFQEAEFRHKNAAYNVEQRLADVNTSKTNLGFANIYSPIEGVVLSKEISEGQTVAATFNTPTLFTIAKDLSKMQVEASVDEADIANVKVGQRVTFTVDAHPDEVFTGTVSQVRLNAKISASVVTYTCILEADNQSGLLMPGMTATITIYTKEETGLVLLENRALNFQPDLEQLNRYIKERFPQAIRIEKLPVAKNKNTRIVWVVDQERIVPKLVTIGISDGINTEIKNGLISGEVILVHLEKADRKVPKPNKGLFNSDDENERNRRK